jgi:hypothetical protein
MRNTTATCASSCPTPTAPKGFLRNAPRLAGGLDRHPHRFGRSREGRRDRHPLVAGARRGPARKAGDLLRRARRGPIEELHRAFRAGSRCQLRLGHAADQRFPRPGARRPAGALQLVCKAVGRQRAADGQAVGQSQQGDGPAEPRDRALQARLRGGRAGGDGGQILNGIKLIPTKGAVNFLVDEFAIEYVQRDRGDLKSHDGVRIVDGMLRVRHAEIDSSVDNDLAWRVACEFAYFLSFLRGGKVGPGHQVVEVNSSPEIVKLGFLYADKRNLPKSFYHSRFSNDLQSLFAAFHNFIRDEENSLVMDHTIEFRRQFK